jgi:hypothetical protein
MHFFPAVVGIVEDSFFRIQAKATVGNWLFPFIFNMFHPSR